MYRIRLSPAPNLEHGTAHLWRALLGPVATETLADARSLLSEDELQRAARFVDAEARARFTLRRSFLRQVISRYAGVAPEALTFAYGEMGKPSLSGITTPIEFNQSDSGLWTVVAVCDAPVGVDIEAVRPGVDRETVAGEVFTDRERVELAARPEAERLQAFFNGWTRKEAVIKALGTGLAYSLQNIDVSLAPGAAPKVNRLGDQVNPEWSVEVFGLDGDVVGAIAVPRAGVRFVHLPQAV